MYVAVAKHKTTENLELKKAFTVSFATKKTEQISDYFGVVSGNKEDKIAKTGVHVTKSNFVDAPIIEEYPLTLECKVDSFENGELIGTIVNCSIDEDYLDENGNIDVDKMKIITFDMVSNTYRVLGEVVGKAFKEPKVFSDNDLELPFIVDLSIKLKYYNIIDKTYFDIKKLVNDIWK